MRMRRSASILHIFNRGKIKANKHRYQRKYYKTNNDIHKITASAHKTTVTTIFTSYLG